LTEALARGSVRQSAVLRHEMRPSDLPRVDQGVFFFVSSCLHQNKKASLGNGVPQRGGSERE
jgi:hypothetical protein